LHLRHLASLLALPLLAACAPELHTTVTTSEIARVAATGQPIEATALLRLPQPGFAECEANLSTLVARLEALVSVATEPRCIAQGLDAFAELHTPLPIVDFEAKPDHRLAALVALPTNSGATDLAFRLLTSYDDIFYTLAADISPRPRLDPAVIAIALRNDGAAPLTLLAGGEVLVDGEAVPRETSLPAGATAELRLTAVAATLVESGTDYTFASFRAQ
jgi:hypothetical protein